MAFIDGDHFDESQCRDLLGRTQIGHVALSVRALPAVVPLPYAVTDAGIFIGCDVDQVAEAMERSVVALQSDGFDEDARKRWTVLVIGLTQRTRHDEIDPGQLGALGTANVNVVLNAFHLFRLDPNVFSGQWLKDF